jgi:hypothetical protein
MPSIPQSLLWISLVVLWLFVLVPMLISKRDAVRRTSDVALATRVLNGSANTRLIKRGGPAAGHRSDPDWKPQEDWDEDSADGVFADADANQERDHELDAEAGRACPVVMRVAVAEPTEPDYLDVDVIEDSGALPAGVSASVSEPVLDLVTDETGFEAAHEENEPVGEQDDYEYIEDSSGLEPGADDEDSQAPAARPASRRRRFDTQTAEAVSARKYIFRKRVLMVLAAVLIGSATAAFRVSPSAWWICGSATVVTLFYLSYLRRQTRIEEKVRRRRTQRMARARVGVENTHDREYDMVPSRLRRPGAVVLEIDDEDPIFEHLDYAMPMRNYGGWPRDLQRAVGE